MRPMCFFCFCCGLPTLPFIIASMPSLSSSHPWLLLTYCSLCVSASFILSYGRNHSHHIDDPPFLLELHHSLVDSNWCKICIQQTIYDWMSCGQLINVLEEPWISSVLFKCWKFQGQSNKSFLFSNLLAQGFETCLGDDWGENFWQHVFYVSDRTIEGFLVTETTSRSTL